MNIEVSIVKDTDHALEKMGRQVSYETVEERQKVFRKVITDVKTRYPNLLVYDPLPILCRRGLCLYSFNGNFIYRDSHHLTECGSEYLASNLLRGLREH